MRFLKNSRELLNLRKSSSRETEENGKGDSRTHGKKEIKAPNG